MLGLVFGILGGLIGVGAAVFALFYTSGIFEYLGGNKKSSFPAVSEDKLKGLILTLNSIDKPFEIKFTPETDFIVEWKIADARWFAFFGKERLQQTYRAFLRLDDSRKTVRYCEELVKIHWVAGSDGSLSPAFSYQKQFFRGRILFQKSWEVQYGLKEDLSFGKVYEYKYDIREIRNPIRHLVIENGWEFVPVINKNHAVFENKNVAIQR